MGDSRINDFYSYIFQEEEDITAAYFTTRSETGYRVYFYPITAYFEHFQEGNLINKTGYFFDLRSCFQTKKKLNRLTLRLEIRSCILSLNFITRKAMILSYCFLVMMAMGKIKNELTASSTGLAR